jgi:hypothetical protein
MTIFHLSGVLLKIEKKQFKLIQNLGSSIGVSDPFKKTKQSGIESNSNTDEISALKADLHELRQRKDLREMSELELVALAGEHTLAIIKATKEAEQKVKSELDSLRIATEKKVSQERIKSENEIKSSLQKLAKEVEEVKSAALKEAARIKSEADQAAQSALDKASAKISEDRLQEQRRLERIRRDIINVSKHLDSAYLTLKGQIETAGSTLAQYNNTLAKLEEDLKNPETDNFKD